MRDSGGPFWQLQDKGLCAFVASECLVPGLTVRMKNLEARHRQPRSTQGLGLSTHLGCFMYADAVVWLKAVCGSLTFRAAGSKSAEADGALPNGLGYVLLASQEWSRIDGTVYR